MTVRRSRSLFKEVPLQYSCLENPMDRWAWWAAAYGVAQSWTQLKRLSSSTLRVLCEYQLGECLLSRFSHVRLFVTPRTVAHRAPLSVGFSRQEYWNRLLCPPPGDLPDPGIKPAFLMTLGLAGQFFTTSATWEARVSVDLYLFFGMWYSRMPKSSHKSTHKCVYILSFRTQKPPTAFPSQLTRLDKQYRGLQ